MKHFLLKFSLFFFVFVLFIFSINRWADYYVRNNRFYKLNDSVTGIIIGHSHAEGAYIDSLLPNTVNMAQSGESYFYSYIKLRKLLEANNNIRRVMIEVTNNNLEKEMDEWTFGEMYVRYRYQKYAHLLHPEELRLLFSKNPLAVTDAVAVTVKNNLDYRRVVSMPYYTYTDWGGFKKWEKSKIDSFLQLQKEQQQIKPAVTAIPVFKESVYNLRFLDSMVALCRRYQKQVLFLRAPQYPSPHNAFADSIYFKTLSARYATIPLINLGNMQLPDEEYLDFQHVNFKGAIKVSRKLDSVLRQQYPLSF